MLAVGRVLALWRHALGLAVVLAVVASVYLYYRAEYNHAKRLRVVTDGTLYPVLYRLEAAGLVDVRWETPKRGVPRKYYQLTRTGRTELARLTGEWTAFAEAMTRLLRQHSEGQ